MNGLDALDWRAALARVSMETLSTRCFLHFRRNLGNDRMKTISTNPLRLIAPASLALLSLFLAVPPASAHPAPASPPHPAAPDRPDSTRPASTRITSTPLQVDRLDPASARIIPANAKLDRVATGFT